MEKKPSIQCKNVVPGNKRDNYSRRDLLSWINTTLDVEVERVEELCSGSMYCFLLNILFPGSVPLTKIKFNANQQHEYITNLRVLQYALSSVGCNKTVPIDRLILARFQDNFEFLQWFKAFFDVNYDPESAAAPCPKQLLLLKSSNQKTLILKSNKKPLPALRGKPGASASSSQAHFVDTRLPPNAQIQHLEEKVAIEEAKINSVTQERNFYFAKCRALEDLCKAHEQDGAEPEMQGGLVPEILAKLYETEAGFATPEYPEDFGPESY